MSKQKKLFASGIFNIYNLHMCKDMCHARGGGGGGWPGNGKKGKN